MALAGSIAGGIAGTLGNPAELIMVRMQADKAKPVESTSFYVKLCCRQTDWLYAMRWGHTRWRAGRYNYRNSIQGLYRMAREEGISSWARGIVPNGVRAILMNMSQLARWAKLSAA
jgi:dicarboxylate transporter 10